MPAGAARTPGYDSAHRSAQGLSAGAATATRPVAGAADDDHESTPAAAAANQPPHPATSTTMATAAAVAAAAHLGTAEAADTHRSDAATLHHAAVAIQRGAVAIQRGGASRNGTKPAAGVLCMSTQDPSSSRSTARTVPQRGSVRLSGL